jgi:hypothetical protein
LIVYTYHGSRKTENGFQHESIYTVATIIKFLGCV